VLSSENTRSDAKPRAVSGWHRPYRGPRRTRRGRPSRNPPARRPRRSAGRGVSRHIAPTRGSSNRRRWSWSGRAHSGSRA